MLQKGNLQILINLFRKTKYNEQDKINIRKYPAIFLNGTHISMIIPGYDENEERDEEEKEE